MQIERRTIELRVESDDTGEPTKFVGYAAVFNSRTDLGWYHEEIAPGAFTRAIEENQDVRALINHDANLVLGRTTAGTLTLTEDDHGLRMEIDPPDTTAARDLMTLVERGDVSQCSFGFIAQKEEWADDDDDGEVRRLIDCDLFDCSVVTFPAYPDTEVDARSVEQVYRDHNETEGDHTAPEGDPEPAEHLPVWAKAQDDAANA